MRIADITRIVDNTGALPELICQVEGDRVQVTEGSCWKKNEILALLTRKQDQSTQLP